MPVPNTFLFYFVLCHFISFSKIIFYSIPFLFFYEMYSLLAQQKAKTPFLLFIKTISTSYSPFPTKPSVSLSFPLESLASRGKSSIPWSRRSRQLSVHFLFFLFQSLLLFLEFFHSFFIFSNLFAHLGREGAEGKRGKGVKK